MNLTADMVTSWHTCWWWHHQWHWSIKVKFTLQCSIRSGDQLLAVLRSGNLKALRFSHYTTDRERTRRCFIGRSPGWTLQTRAGRDPGGVTSWPVSSRLYDYPLCRSATVLCVFIFQSRCNREQVGLLSCPSLASGSPTNPGFCRTFRLLLESSQNREWGEHLDWSRVVGTKLEPEPWASMHNTRTLKPKQPIQPSWLHNNRSNLENRNECCVFFPNDAKLFYWVSCTVKLSGCSSSLF